MLLGTSGVYKSMNMSASHHLMHLCVCFLLYCLCEQGCGDISRVTNEAMETDTTDENVSPDESKYSLVVYDSEDPAKLMLKSGIIPENNYSKQGGG